jgi:hypothetical protein
VVNARAPEFIAGSFREYWHISAYPEPPEKISVYRVLTLVRQRKRKYSCGKSNAYPEAIQLNDSVKDLC